MCAVLASRPDSLKIVKTGDVVRNAAQQPEWPGCDRKERRRSSFFVMRPMFFCPPCGRQGWTAARHMRTGRRGCGTHGALWRTFGQCREAEDRSHLRAQATAGASRLWRPPCAGTAWPPCMRWQRHRPAGHRQSVRGRTLRVSARAGSEDRTGNWPEGREHWPRRKGGARAPGGRSPAGQAGGCLQGRAGAARSAPVMPKARMLPRVAYGASWRGRGDREHWPERHAEGAGSAGWRTGPAGGNACGRGGAARPPGGSMRDPCAGPWPACEIKVKYPCRMYGRLAAQGRAAGRASGHRRRLAPELISG